MAGEFPRLIIATNNMNFALAKRAEEKASGEVSKSTTANTIAAIKAWDNPTFRPHFILFAKNVLGERFAQLVEKERGILESRERRTARALDEKISLSMGAVEELRTISNQNEREAVARRIAERGLEIAVEEANIERAHLATQIVADQNGGKHLGWNEAVTSLAQVDVEYENKIQNEPNVEKIYLVQEALRDEITRQRNVSPKPEGFDPQQLVLTEELIDAWRERELNDAAPRIEFPQGFNMQEFAASIFGRTSQTDAEADSVGLPDGMGENTSSHTPATVGFIESSASTASTSQPTTSDITYIEGLPYTSDEVTLLRELEAEQAANTARLNSQGAASPEPAEPEKAEAHGGRITGEEYIEHEAESILAIVYENPVIGEIVKKGELLTLDQVRNTARRVGNFSRAKQGVEERAGGKRRFSAEELIEVMVEVKNYNSTNRKRVADRAKKEIERVQTEYAVQHAIDTFLIIMVGANPLNIYLPRVGQKKELGVFRKQMERLGQFADAFLNGMTHDQLKGFLDINNGRLVINDKEAFKRLANNGNRVNINRVIEFIFHSHTGKPLTPELVKIIEGVVKNTRSLIEGEMARLQAASIQQRDEVMERIRTRTHTP